MIEQMKKDVILSFVSWLLLLSLFIAGLAVIAQDEARQLPGDGFEYLMMPVSIMNHGSTYVTDQDIEDAKAYYGNNIFDTIYRAREDVTLVTGSDGNRYAKHFGLYSVLCMPLRGLFHVIGINPAKAFQYMNLLFWLGACLVVQLFLNSSQFKKTLLMMFLVINPAWFYLTWVHTEILMYSLVILGLVLRSNKKFMPAMFCISLGAMNNLTLLVPAFLLGIEFLITTYNEAEKDKLKVTFKKTLPVLIAAIPGFIPIIRSFIMFGNYSPVASVAAVSVSSAPSDNRLICALSYIFDPNQGMIAYTLLIAPAFLITVIANIIRRKEVVLSVLNIISIIAMLFIVSQELHINCGMAYIMRYNVWIMPFMAFYNVFYLSPKFTIPVFGISSLWTMVVMVVFTILSGTNFYLDYTPFGKFVMNYFPTLYNPPVGIYYSRTLTEESYYCKFPVPYFDEEGNLRKILITPEAASCIDDGEWTIYGPDMNVVDYRDLPSTNINGESFTYVSLSDEGYHMVRDMDTLDFSDLTENDISLIRSSVGYEGDLALVYGKELHLLMHMLPGTYEGCFDLENVFGGVQDIVIRVNGEVVFQGPVYMDDDNITFEYTVGDDFLCDIEVDIPGAFSPQSVIPESEDDRVLSLYLTEFEFSPVA